MPPKVGALVQVSPKVNVLWQLPVEDGDPYSPLPPPGKAFFLLLLFIIG